MNKKKETAVQKHQPTHAERFIAKVQHEIQSSIGHGTDLNSHEKQLATNMFLAIDASLKQAEAKRAKQNRKDVTPYTWEAVNMQKLATDAMHRVKLGLDAIIPNHLWTIPYMNGKTGRYDLDLYIGYKGKIHYRAKMSTDKIVDIRLELVYDSDEFEVLKKSHDRSVETYKYEITNPFNRGTIIGGFGYIMYDDERKNKVVLVSEEDFKKIEKTAKSSDFWSKWPVEMRFKTLAHRVTDQIDIDPTKVNKHYHYVEGQDNEFLDPSKEVKSDPKYIGFGDEDEPEEKPDTPAPSDIDDNEQQEAMDQELPFNKG